MIIMAINEEDFLKIQNELWNVVNQYVGPEDTEVIFALSGSMMGIAIELYSILLTDEDIEDILEEVVKDIPKIRKKMIKSLGKKVVH